MQARTSPDILLHGSMVKSSLSAVQSRYCVTRSSPTRTASTREERKRFLVYQFLLTMSRDGKVSEARNANVLPFACTPNNANFRNVTIFDTVILLVIASAMVNCELGSFRSLIPLLFFLKKQI
jgi:hypothetical protein